MGMFIKRVPSVLLLTKLISAHDLVNSSVVEDSVAYWDNGFCMGKVSDFKTYVGNRYSDIFPFDIQNCADPTKQCGRLETNVDFISDHFDIDLSTNTVNRWRISVNPNDGDAYIEDTKTHTYYQIGASGQADWTVGTKLIRKLQTTTVCNRSRGLYQFMKTYVHFECTDHEYDTITDFREINDCEFYVAIGTEKACCFDKDRHPKPSVTFGRPLNQCQEQILNLAKNGVVFENKTDTPLNHFVRLDINTGTVEQIVDPANTQQQIKINNGNWNGKWNTNDLSLSFTNGDKCNEFNINPRETIVTFKCPEQDYRWSGDKWNGITSYKEPNMCRYELEVSTKAACGCSMNEF